MEIDKNKLKAFSERVFDDMSASLASGMAYVGVKTGLFRVMAQQGPMSCEQVVERSGLQARYVEEWLKGVVTAEYLEYDPAEQTYCLPDEHAYMLASDDTDHFVGGLYSMVPVLLAGAPQVAQAFTTGGGVPFSEIGDEGVLALDLLNRGAYQHRFVSYWLAAMPAVVEQLESGARALDVGCGSGHVATALANAFPKSDILGIDPDRASIEQARISAGESGASFEMTTTTGLLTQDGAAQFDFISACDCIHDFPDPLATLKEIRQMLTPDGTFLIIEPKVADQLEDNINSVGTMFYGFSLFHCMTQSLAADGCGMGACAGPAQTQALLAEAGFGSVAMLPIKSQVNLFYVAKR